LRRKGFKLPGIKNLPRASTIMFVPHSQQSTYSIKIPFGIMFIFFSLALFSIILLVSSTVKYLNMKENMSELNALRSVNERQAGQLRLMESEVLTLRGEMTKLKSLERDVRGLLNSGPFLEQPVAVRQDTPQPSRGGGRGGGADSFRNVLAGFLDGSPSFIERQAEWDATYQATRNTAGELLASVEAVEKNLALLQEDVSKIKDYFEARPAGFPAAGEISSGFGLRRSPFSGRSEMHPGVDIAANYGAPVAAAGKGAVVFAGYRAGYGLTVVIGHKYGFETVYGHNSSLKVQAGQEVARGDLIARVGSTGASTGPHLHYEVLLNGVRVDPAGYLTEPVKHRLKATDAGESR